MKSLTSIILPWMMLLSTATCIAQTLNAESPRVVSSDEIFRIVFTADARMSDFNWPGTDDFDVVWGPQKGSMSSNSIVNGKRTPTHQETVIYLLRPRRTGTFTIAAASAKVDKQEVSSGTLQIEVVAGETEATTATRVPSSPHLTFKGIPITGSLSSFGMELVKAGFLDNGDGTYTGDFAGYSNCMVTPFGSNSVKEVRVDFPFIPEWDALEKAYDSLQASLTQQYGMEPKTLNFSDEAVYKLPNGTITLDADVQDSSSWHVILTYANAVTSGAHAGYIDAGGTHNRTIPQNTTQSVDDLSEQGLMLIGRFRDNDWRDRDRSVRVFEIQNKTILCIGYTDDIGGNINLKYLAIEKPDWPAFEAKMAIVNEKFTKWTQIAHEENERNFRKKIPVDFGNIVGTLSMGFVNNYHESELYAIFEVDSKGECSLRLDSWEEYDESNSSFESQMHTPFFVFKSPAYFNVLYQLIKQDNLKRSIEIMKAKIATKKRAEDDRSAKYD